MEGKEKYADRIIMEKPYLSIPGLDYLGHAVFRNAVRPLAMHQHTNCMEIVLVMRGSQTYYTEDTEYQITGGQAFVTHPGQPHCTGGSCQDVGEFYWMLLDLSCPESFLGFNRELSSETVGRLLEIEQRVFQFDNAVKTQIKWVFREFDRIGTTPKAVAGMMHLIYLILECAQKRGIRHNDYSKLERYLEEHISENISAEMMSQICNVSVSTLQHRFKEYFGRSPAEYMNYKKIQKARQLLLEGKSVTETAMLLGFSSSDYFSTVFRKFSGINPTAWKKSITKVPSE